MHTHAATQGKGWNDNTSNYYVIADLFFEQGAEQPGHVTAFRDISL